MADFNVRSDSVNVEQIMEQIRARIREKRGVDYTEQQIHELASRQAREVPRSARRAVGSARPVQADNSRRSSRRNCLNYCIRGDARCSSSHRAPLRFIRRAAAADPEAAFFNPNPLIQALQHPVAAEHDAAQTRSRSTRATRRRRRSAALRGHAQPGRRNNARSGSRVKNLKMRVESLASRLEFNERRARALESAVVRRWDERVKRAGIGAARNASRATQRRRSRSRKAARAPRRPPSMMHA